MNPAGAKGIMIRGPHRDRLGPRDYGVFRHSEGFAPPQVVDSAHRNHLRSKSSLAMFAMMRR
jgi:hypothetical protein